MRNLLIAAAGILFFAFVPGDKLVGRWETKPSVNGHTTGVVFKADGAFEGYVNKKPFVSGNYTFKDETITFTDNGCDGSKAIYKVVFFSYEDSLRFEPISDTFTHRRNGMTRLILGRVK